MNAHDIGPEITRITTVNFSDKHYRGKGFSSKEGCAFSGICTKGLSQILECYKNIPGWLSPFDCREACSQCPFVFVPDDAHHSPNISKIFSPFYINDMFEGDIDFDNPKGFVYFITDGATIKIGSASNIEKRLYSLQTGNCRELSLKYAIPFKSREAAGYAENRLHWLYKDWLIRGEWFDLLDKLGANWSLMFGTHWLSEEDAS